jgi:hypothetical protein
MQVNHDWSHCGLEESQFKITRLPRGKEDSWREFSVASNPYAKRKNPKHTKEQHEEECRKMAEASLKKAENEAMVYKEAIIELD